MVYQPVFVDGDSYGRADFVKRVDKPSKLGNWSYEVVEAKLARATKVRAVIQLCHYSLLLSKIRALTRTGCTLFSAEEPCRKSFWPATTSLISERSNANTWKPPLAANQLIPSRTTTAAYATGMAAVTSSGEMTIV